MPLKRHAALLELSLRHATARPLLSLPCSYRSRRFASSNSAAAHPDRIGIVGGGISGLASAHFVSKEFPQSKITIVEKGDEVGGWIKSRRVDVDGGNVLFEYGPRTLRPGTAALPTMQLIQDLGLLPDVLYTHKDSPAARNRYIYYPDRLNRFPAKGSDYDFSTVWNLLSSGILAGFFNMLFEPFQAGRRKGRTDESVGDFIKRRVDHRIADNMVSAVLHGIYAGDIYQLSARTLMSTAWALEGEYGSVFGGLFSANSQGGDQPFSMLMHPYDCEQTTNMVAESTTLDQDFIDRLSNASTITFRNGLQQMVKRLEESLRQNEQVEFVTGTSVNEYKLLDGKQSIQMSLAKGSETPKETQPSETRDFDLIVSTRPTPGLTEGVTVMVVNLFYREPPIKIMPGNRGFGYLIPRSVPFEQNPERALGVIFDHDAVQGQDSVDGTKLTVMLGGHWWDGWSDYPTSEEGIMYAKSVVERHLGIMEKSTVAHATLNRNAIPQYTVGYEDRLKGVAESLKKDYNGRLRVVGSQYNGVGVNDCIRSAWQLARDMKGNGWKSQSVGLDRVLDTREWVLTSMQTMKARDARDRT